jgi:2'-5' RNA ligase
MPSGKLNADLTHLITELAREFSAPIFRPHVTLLGGLTGELAALKEQCEELAASLKSFEIHLTEPEHLDDYYRSLFIRVALSPPLRQAYLQAREVFDISGDLNYQPHLSLLYGHHPAELKERVIAKTKGQRPMKFSVDHFYLINLASEPQAWTRIGDFHFPTDCHQ